MQENPSDFSNVLNHGPVPGQIELGPNPVLRIAVPVFVASLGILMCALLMFLPSKDSTLKLVGLLVLATDIATAVFLSRIFGSQKLTANESGIEIDGIFGSKTISWSQIATYNRIAYRGDIQFRVYDADGQQTGRWSGYLGTPESRERLTALLDSKTNVNS